jgi:hypothetical protein
VTLFLALGGGWEEDAANNGPNKNTVNISH